MCTKRYIKKTTLNTSMTVIGFMCVFSILFCFALVSFGSLRIEYTIKSKPNRWRKKKKLFIERNFALVLIFFSLRSVRIVISHCCRKTTNTQRKIRKHKIETMLNRLTCSHAVVLLLLFGTFKPYSHRLFRFIDLWPELFETSSQSIQYFMHFHLELYIY